MLTKNRKRRSVEEQRAANAARMARWREANPDENKRRKALFYQRNKEKIRERRSAPEFKEQHKRHEAARRSRNKDEINSRRRAIRESDPDRFRALDRGRNGKKLVQQRHAREAIDPSKKFSPILRNRIRHALKGKGNRPGSAIAYLGCTPEELRQRFEGMFKQGMSWENWGNTAGCWHVDHIIPLSSFDLTDLEQFATACHYTNLQPLWWHENIRKGAKIPPPE